jgi:hypothetical protein
MCKTVTLTDILIGRQTAMGKITLLDAATGQERQRIFTSSIQFLLMLMRGWFVNSFNMES